MNEIKIKEYKWGGPKGNKYTEYHFIDESGGSDLRIEILPKYSIEEAIEYSINNKGYIIGAYQLPSGTIIVPDDILDKLKQNTPTVTTD